MTPVEIFISDVQNEPNLPIKLIQFQGQFDESNIEDKAKVVYQIIEDQPGAHFIFHLRGLDYMNSKSIGFLTDWCTRINQTSSQAKIADAQDHILDILDSIGITSVIDYHNSVDEAKLAILGIS